MSKVEFLRRLTLSGAPLDRWGSKEEDTKSPEDFWDEHLEGAAAIDFAKLRREINTALIHIWGKFPDGDGEFIRKKIIEMKRPNGALFAPRPGHEASLSEKLRFLKAEPEPEMEGILRGLIEELALHHRVSGNLIQMSDIRAMRKMEKKSRIEERPSDSYPGFVTVNNICEFTWEMPEEFIKPYGYRMMSTDGVRVISYFPWVNPQLFGGRIEHVAPQLYG